ncbi:MAG: glycosyltransferase family 1 protein [Chloroflexi bacterium]|nr:glycosyltransferase family 1 protein [Chloroflexota bacterium]
MKIGLNAHLLSDHASYRSAGIHSYIAHLLQHLPAQAPADWRFQAMVGAASRAAFNGVAMSRARFDTTAAWRRIFWEQVIQPRQLRRFDLYHALAFVAPLYLKAPMVVTVYDLSFLLFPDRLSPARRWYLRNFTALTCRRALRVLAISRSTATDLARLLGVNPGKIDVTPLGYDRSVFRPLPAAAVKQFRARQGLPDRFWLFVGTLEPRKNLVMLLRAYARLPRAGRLPLILVGGKGWMTDDVFTTIERDGLQDSVRHVGFVPAADLPLWYNSAEAFLYPSIYEGFGLPVLEAMACGTPVLTADISSLPEVVGDAGLCLPPEDTEPWTAALVNIKQDLDWREEARERGLYRAKRFSWERTAALTLDSYRKALAAHGLPLNKQEPDTIPQAQPEDQTLSYAMSVEQELRIYAMQITRQSRYPSCERAADHFAAAQRL